MNPNLFQTHCTWKAVDGKNISEAVTWTDANENSDIEETIQAENCILLEYSGKAGLSTECRLSLMCQPPYVIQQVAVLCEARLVEVYGQHQEYLRTLRCEMVDEMDDMIVFRAQVKLDKPVSECSLKFTGLKSKTSMWLYGVVAYIDLPQPPTSVLLSAAQRFSSQQAVQDRPQMDGQLMALMSLMGSQGQHKSPLEQLPQSPMLPQQHPGFYPQMYAQPPNTRIAPQYPQPPFQTPFGQVATPNEPVLNQTTGPQLASKPETNSNVPEVSNPSQQPQMPPELAQMLQLMNSPNAMNLMTNLLQKMQNENAESKKPQTPQASAAQEAPVLEQTKAQPEAVESAKALPPEQPQAQPSTVAPPVAAPVATSTAALPAQAPELAPQPVEAPVPAVAPTSPPRQKKALEAQATAQPVPVPVPVPVPEPLSEAVAVSKLSGGAVEQISESVVTGIECSLEHLEERLWGKVRHRLQEMENKILNRLDEMFDALREEEDSEPRDLQEDLEDEEEESLSMGPDGSVLQI